MKADVSELSRKELRKAGAGLHVLQAENSAELLQEDPEEMERTCVHEGGHVALCEILGVSVTKFSGPGVSVHYDDDGDTNLSNHLAMVTHDNTTRWGTVNPFVALKQNSLISVAGEAAEFVVMGVKYSRRGGYYSDSSDNGLYDEVHGGREGFPNMCLSKKELDAKWRADFETVVSILKTPDARRILDDATERFRRFMTTNVTIDLSALKPQHRRSREVIKKVTELNNRLMGPNAALDKMLKYSAAKAVLFVGLGIKTTFKGPNIRYGSDVGQVVTNLADNIGGLTPSSGWVEKLMRPLTNAMAKKTMLEKIALVLLIGNAYVYGEADKGYGRDNVGDSSYRLTNRIVQLFRKYDDDFKSEMEKFEAQQKKAGTQYWRSAWKKRQKLEKELVDPLREAAILLVKDAVSKKAITAKVKEFERQIAKQ